MKPYPAISPFDTGLLPVGNGHALYYEQAGNPEGKAVVYLHGGPGAGCSFEESRLFNPDHYRVIMFDQRGAGKSTPSASVDHNTIQDLIEDLEKLRVHLGVERWSVAGGSWGSTLALLYAQQHPDCTERLLLRGIFFGDDEGAAHIIEDGGANRKRDDFFAQYQTLVPAKERNNGLLVSYYNLLVGDDYDQAVEAAKRFDLWDTSIATSTVNHEWLKAIEQNPEASLPLSRIFFHFARHEFVAQNRQSILTPNDALKTTSIDIIHGEVDLICPVENARALHAVYPNSYLHIIPDNGHVMTEPGIGSKFLEITERWLKEDVQKSLPILDQKL